MKKASEDEYLALERQSEVKHELVNGLIVAMAGGSPRHNLIAMNLGRALGARLRTKPCTVYGSDQRVHVPATGLYTYPDLTVVCGRPQVHPKSADTILNPLVIVEVLSESAEAYDRGAKFAHYQSIASLSEYVLVSQPERRVEHYRRLDTGQWLLTVAQGEEASISLPALDAEVSLAEIYEKVDLLDESPAPGAT